MLFEGLLGRFLPKQEARAEIKKKEIPKFSGSAESVESWFEYEEGVKHENQDAFIYDENHQVGAVFDGVGGVEGGKEAAQAAKQVFENFFLSLPFELTEAEAEQKMRAAMNEAHVQVQNIRIEGQDTPPGTTAAVLKFFQDPKTKDYYGLIANVGDSRVYQMTRGSLRRVTRDHNKQYGQEMEAAGKRGMRAHVDAKSKGVQDALDNWEGKNYKISNGTDIEDLSKTRNVVTSTLGIGEDSPNYVDTIVVRNISFGDAFLLMSDGVYDNLSMSEIEQIVKDALTPEVAAKHLVEAAYARSLEYQKKGGNLRAKPDDITVVCIRLSKSPKANDSQP